jgi:pantothenate kinase
MMVGLCKKMWVHGRHKAGRYIPKKNNDYLKEIGEKAELQKITTHNSSLSCLLAFQQMLLQILVYKRIPM